MSMKRLLTFLFILVLLVFGLSFTVLNANDVVLNYYFATVELPLALVILGALTLGALLGLFASISLVLAGKADVARLHRKVQMTEKEIKNLREIPIKNKH